MRELEEIENDYKNGKLKEAERCLDNYVQLNRIHIINYQEECEKRYKRKIDVILALKMHIQEVKAIDTKQEAAEQIEEMKREAYYLGEKTGKQQDLQYVCSQWSREHAKGWRGHRILIICYLVEKNKSRYQELLR